MPTNEWKCAITRKVVTRKVFAYKQNDAKIERTTETKMRENNGVCGLSFI